MGSLDPIENKAIIVSTIMYKFSPPNFRPRPLTNIFLLKLLFKLLVFCFRIFDSRYRLVLSGGPCTRRKLSNCLSKIGTGVWKNFLRQNHFEVKVSLNFTPFSNSRLFRKKIKIYAFLSESKIQSIFLKNKLLYYT